MTISSTTTRSTSSKSGGVTTRHITRTRNGKSSTSTIQTNSFKSMGGTARNTVRISNPTPKAHKVKVLSSSRSPSNRQPKRMSNSLVVPSSKSSYQRSNSNSTGSGGDLGILIILGLIAGAVWGIWEFISWAYTSIKGKFQ